MEYACLESLNLSLSTIRVRTFGDARSVDEVRQKVQTTIEPLTGGEDFVLSGTETLKGVLSAKCLERKLLVRGERSPALAKNAFAQTDFLTLCLGVLLDFHSHGRFQLVLYVPRE